MVAYWCVTAAATLACLCFTPDRMPEHVRLYVRRHVAAHRCEYLSLSRSRVASSYFSFPDPAHAMESYVARCAITRVSQYVHGHISTPGCQTILCISQAIKMGATISVARSAFTLLEKIRAVCQSMPPHTCQRAIDTYNLA